jgi:hypothetical protein
VKTLDMGGADDALGSDPFARRVPRYVMACRGAATTARALGSRAGSAGGLGEGSETQGGRAAASPLSLPAGMDPSGASRPGGASTAGGGGAAPSALHPRWAGVVGPRPPGADRGDAGRGEPTPASRFFLGALPAGAQERPGAARPLDGGRAGSSRGRLLPARGRRPRPGAELVPGANG